MKRKTKKRNRYMKMIEENPVNKEKRKIEMKIRRRERKKKNKIKGKMKVRNN